MTYPHWKYCLDPANPAGYRGVIVNSAEEDRALGEGWVYHPSQLASADDKPPEPARPQQQVKPKKRGK